MNIQIDTDQKLISVQKAETLTTIASFMRDKFPDEWGEYKVVRYIPEVDLWEEGYKAGINANAASNTDTDIHKLSKGDG